MNPGAPGSRGHDPPAPAAGGLERSAASGLHLGSPDDLRAAPDTGRESPRWEDGRPKHWPCLQLRVRGRPFDIYCEHSSDVTLDGIGIPVVNGRTVTQEELKRGWFDSSLSQR